MITIARINHTRGCGGFLNPPTHPEHTKSVDTFARGRVDGCMSLISATHAEYLAPEVRAEAAAILATWERPALESPEVQAWIGQVLGYFRGCYRNPDRSGPDQWHASHLLISDRDPLENADDHAGVRLIRSYYAAYVPNATDFARARWGA